MMKTFNLLASDLTAKAEWCYESRSVSAILKVLLTDGTAAMVWYRLMQWARRWHLYPFELLFNRCNTIFCGCIIGRGAEFGPRFVLIHSHGVVINGNVVGGRDIHIYHQVTLGADRTGAPRLGNNVHFGSGAKILGPVTIGSDVRIGANAVVVKDVPDHATVVGIPPAQVVKIRLASGTEILDSHLS